MIPEFPQFKKIELSDREEINKFTKSYPPYSDFNFVSMWSWDIKGEMQISQLNNNLVVKFTDYITGDYFYSFLGNNKPNETVESLLDLSDKEGFITELKLIPEDSIKGIDTKKFNIKENRDHFDYILDLNHLSTYAHSKLRGHASFHRRFLDEHSNFLSSKVLDLKDEDTRNQIVNLTKIWMQNKVSEQKDFLPKLEDVIHKYFMQESFNNKDFISVGIFHNNKMIAFTINELEEGDFSVCHFMKANSAFKGVYSYLVSETSKVLLAKGKKYINFEQDLGLSNLRQSKKTYYPIDFLKKFNISKK